MSIELDFVSVLSQWPLLLKGVAWTLGLTAVSAVLGVLLGIACAWVRTEGPAWSRPAVATYVELIRNTPFIIQLFFIFFGLPALGLRLSPEWSSVIAMVINLGAYSAALAYRPHRSGKLRRRSVWRFRVCRPLSGWCCRRHCSASGRRW